MLYYDENSIFYQFYFQHKNYFQGILCNFSTYWSFRRQSYVDLLWHRWPYCNDIRMGSMGHNPRQTVAAQAAWWKQESVGENNCVRLKSWILITKFDNVYFVPCDVISLSKYQWENYGDLKWHHRFVKVDNAKSCSNKVHSSTGFYFVNQ